jgi:hypothetical protein
MYKELILACDEVFSELPPICSLSELHIVGKRMRKTVGDETSNPWKSLYEMGVIGYIDPDQGQRKSAYYEYGLFHFNSANPIRFANHIRYCVHPLFSGAWRLKRQSNMKFVCPSKIDETFWN